MEDLPRVSLLKKGTSEDVSECQTGIVAPVSWDSQLGFWQLQSHQREMLLIVPFLLPQTVALPTTNNFDSIFSPW